jgi:glycosyltransferase involved in cell wall biosynthesis
MPCVAVYFDSDASSGGSYQMSINNLLALRNKFLKKNLSLYIFLEKHNKDLDKLNIKYEVIKISIFDKIFQYLINFIFFKILVNKFSICSPFEKKFIRRDISLILFLIPNFKQLLFQKIKMVSTLLDTCHKDFPEFDELNSFQIFQFRELLNKEILQRSVLIITESEELKNKISYYYRVEKNRIISIPNIPSSLALNEPTNIFKEKVKIKFDLDKKFYFYPAQFWPHKNHSLILSSIKILKDKYNRSINFVFCGLDKQKHKEFIKNKIVNLGIEKNVKILDYLSHDEVGCLLRLSNALVMPTFLGPTNMPPVEAWNSKIPVIYSSLLKNHGRNAALYFDPYSAEELAQKIIELDSHNTKKILVENGLKRVAVIEQQNEDGITTLFDKIDKFIEHRSSWRA